LFPTEVVGLIHPQIFTEDEFQQLKQLETPASVERERTDALGPGLSTDKCDDEDKVSLTLP
jgi:hypothetical protein